MKKTLLSALFFCLLVKVWGQPQIINPTFPSSVGLFDLLEISFEMGSTYSNPYDPNVIDIVAMFIAPDNTTYKVNAFYYEGYSFYKQDGYEHAVVDTSTNNGLSWKVRFTPTQTGTWRFRIKANDAFGSTTMPNTEIRNYTFTCTAVNNANGFISKANSRYLKRDIVKNGQRQFHSFFPIGPNIAWYSCVPYDDYSHPTGIYYYQRYIDSLSNQPSSLTPGQLKSIK